MGAAGAGGDIFRSLAFRIVGEALEVEGEETDDAEGGLLDFLRIGEGVGGVGGSAGLRLRVSWIRRSGGCCSGCGFLEMFRSGGRIDRAS